LVTKAPGEGAAILGRPAGAAGRFGNEGFEADNVEGRDEPPERLGERVDFLAKPRKQGALDMVTASFHGVERMRLIPLSQVGLDMVCRHP